MANVQAGTGNDRFAGWALFIAYRDNAQAVRGLHVYDGLGTVDATHTFQTTVAPFHTPVSPAPVTTKVGLLTFEGDAGLATETATFNNVALTDALNPVNNAMNSTIECRRQPPSPRRARTTPTSWGWTSTSSRTWPR